MDNTDPVAGISKNKRTSGEDILKAKQIHVIIINAAWRIRKSCRLQLSFDVTSRFVCARVHYPAHKVPKYLQPEEEQQTEQTENPTEPCLIPT